jgi:hypothetical protein
MKVRDAGAKHGGTIYKLNAGANWLCFRSQTLANAKYATQVAGNVEGIIWGAASKRDTKVASLIASMPPLNTAEYLEWAKALYDGSATAISSVSGAVNLTNVYRGFEMPSGITVRDLGIYGGVWRQTARGFLRFRGNSTGLWVQDVDADCGRVPAEDGFWSTAFELNNYATDAVFLRTKAHRAFDTDRERGYTNGDGFCGERGNKRTWYVRCETDENEDGGVETKAEQVIIVGHKAARNRRNVRLWGWGDAHYVDWRDPTMDLGYNGLRRKGGGPCQAYAYNNTGKVRVFSGSVSSAADDVRTWLADGAKAQLYISRAVQVARTPKSILNSGPVKFFDAGTLP